MKWNEEKEKLYKLICEDKRSYEEIGRIYNVTGAAIKKVARRLEIPLVPRRIINPKETFNKGTGKTSICLYCGKEFRPYSQARGKFCSLECSAAYMKQRTIEDWKTGKNNGTEGYSCSTSVRNYLLKTHDYKCENCGWGAINPYTNRIPLQIHHIDGNSLNNVESNLQVLCPNCHSLTENFGSRNKNAVKGKSAYYGKAKG